MAAIRDVKSGRIDPARTVLQRQAGELLGAGCSHLMLACTEIPVVLGDRESRFSAHCINATDALAEQCVAFFVARGALAQSGRS